MALTPLFDKARYAGLFICIFYFSSSFLDVLVQDKSVDEGSKMLASLIQPVGLYRSAVNIAQLETTGIGV